jgi:hypothetical protein
VLRSKRSKISLSIVILFLVVAIFIANGLSKQAVGKVDNSPATNLSHEAVETESKPLSYAGKYLSFMYPSSYTVSPAQLSGNYLEVVDLNSTSHNENSISIGVEPETLSEDTGISFRKMSPSIYKMVLSSPTMVEFTGATTQGYEQDYFIQHGGDVASLVLTTLTQASAGKDLSHLVSSLKWSN